MKKIIFPILFFLIFVPFLSSSDKLESTDSLTPEEIKKAVKDIQADSVAAKTGFEKFVEDFEKIEGLFTIYRDDEEGKVYLEIKPEQFDQIYLCTMTRQSGDAYMFDASSSLRNFPFFFQKVHKKIRLIEKNLKFRSEDKAMKRALENSISNSILASAKQSCKPHKETGAVLIDAADLFLKDMANVTKSSSRHKMNFSFDKENSYFDQIKSFPLNTEIDVVLHFKNSEGKHIYTLPDSRSMIHRYHYSLSVIPESDYTPRFADDRIGFFNTIFQDYTDLLTETPYIRYIDRWHLEKENPNKKNSKAKNPIVFWLDNTIPDRYKPAVKKGILLWNEAFAEIGIEDAIIVKEKPDDADWEPADARYNTICWIIQPGGGYAVGPSHANPYTGEIYDADIRISADFLRYFYIEYDEVINPEGWTEGLKSAEWKEENFNDINFGNCCHYADGMQQQLSLGYSLLKSRGQFGKSIDLDEFIDQGLSALVCHEVGHTLGLRHNFKGSTVFSQKQLQDEKFTTKKGITGSIMDYVPINLSPIKEAEGIYFHNRIGEWDKWMIEYGYSIFEEEKEEENLEKIARRCAHKMLDYGTDEDTYGMSSRGIDPSCNIFDLGNDPIKFYEDRIQIARELWAEIPANFEKKGKSYKKLLWVFNQGLSEYRGAAHNVSKYIGGLYAHRDHIGDPKGRVPFEVVPAKEQKRALDFLTENILSENAFYFPPELLNKLVYEKMGTFTGSIWSLDRTDYSIHNSIAYIQSIVLSHLFDPLVLGRLFDNELKFKEGEDKFFMSAMFSAIGNSVWNEIERCENIDSFRRELQRMYLHRISEIILDENKNIPHDAISLARFELSDIKDKIESLEKTNLDKITVAHLAETKAKIDAVLQAQIDWKN